MTPIKEGQTIQRVEILAYLDAVELEVPIDVLIRNDDVYDVDLRGWSERDFNCLETDIKESLRELGYRTYAIEHDHLTFSYFKTQKSL